MGAVKWDVAQEPDRWAGAGWAGWPAPSHGYYSRELANSTSLSHKRTGNDTIQPPEQAEDLQPSVAIDLAGRMNRRINREYHRDHQGQVIVGHGFTDFKLATDDIRLKRRPSNWKNKAKLVLIGVSIFLAETTKLRSNKR